MRLLIQNVLICNSKICLGKGNPLELKVTIIDIKEVKYNREFILKVLPNINWSVLVSAAKSVQFIQ